MDDFEGCLFQQPTVVAGERLARASLKFLQGSGLRGSSRIASGLPTKPSRNRVTSPKRVSGQSPNVKARKHKRVYRY
jgi:hypothetical protein